MTDPRMRSLVDAFLADIAEIVRQATVEQLKMVLNAPPAIAARAPAMRPRVTPVEGTPRSARVPAKAAKRPSTKPRAAQLSLLDRILEETRVVPANVAEGQSPVTVRPAAPETHPFVLRRNGERVRRLK